MTAIDTPTAHTATDAPSALAPSPEAVPATVAELSVGPSRARWALWGVAAGVLGFVATIVTDGAGSLAEEDYLLGPDLIDKLDQPLYQAGVIAGFLCVVAMVLTAAGWHRWAGRRAPDSLAARAVPFAFLASAGAMVIGYGLKGSMSVYLDGGLDQGSMTDEGLYSIFMFLDLGAWMVWWGGAAAALLMVWLAFKERLVPRWIGVVSIVFSLPFLGFLFATGLPGMAAVSTIWLAVASLGLAASKRFGAAELAAA